MANAGGNAPQNAPKPKKEYTDEQKRTFALLGVMGVLSLIVAAIYLPGMLSGGGAEPLPVAPTTGATEGMPTGAGETLPPPVPGEAPPAGAPGEPGTAPAVAASAGASQNAFGIPPKHRTDPFVNFVKTAPYLPPPDPPIELPAPEVITIARPEVAPIDAQPLNLPAVRIPRFANQTTNPRDAFVPPRVQGESQPQPSYDKRLSGVVISNGIRALLEVSTGTETRTYVVQPGDSVDGVTVLNIQRVTDGGRDQYRMIIREAGQEKYVDLKAGPPRADITPGGGPDGAPGFPGGFPGAFPGGFPQ